MAVWVVCVGGPFYVMYCFGPYWCLPVAVLANLVWVAFGDLNVGSVERGERVGYSTFPRRVVMYGSIGAMGWAIYVLANRFNDYIKQGYH